MNTCPECKRSTVDHAWRTDMVELKLIDTWKCRSCEHSWSDVVTYQQLVDMPLAEFDKTVRSRW